MPTRITDSLVLCSDHAGFELKEHLKAWLTKQGLTIVDAGCFSADSVDYPKIVESAVAAMGKNKITYGMFVCGSGVGVMIGANRYPHIRATLAHDISTAMMSRRHNDTNVLCLGARVIATQRAEEIVDAWLNEAFEADRHSRRVEQLSTLNAPSTIQNNSEEPSACRI